MVAGLLLVGSAAHAADPTPAVPVARDVLVYKDGDRVQGKLLKKEDGFFIFHSDRFGDLRVPETDAVFVPAEKAVGAVATAPAPSPPRKRRPPSQRRRRRKKPSSRSWPRAGSCCTRGC